MAETETIDATALPQDKKRALAERMVSSINSESDLRHKAISGDLPEGQVTELTEWHGDSLAEAKGRVFKTRDTIEEYTNRETTISHTGTVWQFPETKFYEFEISVEGED